MAFIGNYKKGALLGYGSFGNVFKVTKLNKSYALKRIINIDESALREAKILRKVHHDYIVAHYETFRFKDYLCIVMECADGGTLTSHVIFNWNDGVGAEHNVWRVLELLSDAIGYLHTFRPNPIIHCDIKPDNVLLFTTVSSRESGTKFILKLADFGVAKLMNDKKEDKDKEQRLNYTDASTQCGAAIYMAPEVLRSEPFTFSADIWSLGTIVAFFCNKGEHLFPNAQDVLDWRRGKSVIPYHYSIHLRNLVMDILELEQTNRPSAGKIESECTNKRTERGKHNDTKHDIA